MACDDHKSWGTMFLLSLLSSLEICAHGGGGGGGSGPQVPGYFIIGDSLSDSGNNNALNTNAKANFKPYGIDFPAGPTGRFTNGRTIVDIITEHLGFDHYIPPFATVKDGEMLGGVNYASGGAGIRKETGKNLGDNICLSEQLKNYQTSYSKISKILGGDAAALAHLNKCIFTVNIGSNDYLNNYFIPKVSPTGKLYTPDQYAAQLITDYSQNLDILYKYGARKVALFGLGQLGCTPAEIGLFGASADSNCVDTVNEGVLYFNRRLRGLVDDLNRKYKDAKFTYINMHEIGSGNPRAAGFKVVDSGCCGGRLPCFPGMSPCQNRKEYAFWDEFHPTDALNVINGGRAYKALAPIDVYPIDISTLARI